MFSIKGKRGRNGQADFKGCLASIFPSLKQPVIPQVLLVLKQLPWPGHSHPLVSQVPVMSACVQTARYRNKGIKLTRFPLRPFPSQEQLGKYKGIAKESIFSHQEFNFSEINLLPAKYFNN